MFGANQCVFYLISISYTFCPYCVLILVVAEDCHMTGYHEIKPLDVRTPAVSFPYRWQVSQVSSSSKITLLPFISLSHHMARLTTL